MRPEYCGYFLIPHWYIFWHEKRRCQVGHMMVVVRLLLMCCLAWKCEFNFKQHGDVMLCFVIWPCMYAILVKDVIRLQNCRANHSRTLVACLELHYSSSRLSLWHLFTFSGILSLLSLYILWYVILVQWGVLVISLYVFTWGFPFDVLLNYLVTLIAWLFFHKFEIDFLQSNCWFGPI